MTISYKRRSFSLLEVVIACALAATLLSTVFLSLTGIAKKQREVEMFRTTVVARERCWLRLSKLFATTDNLRWDAGKGLAFHYTDDLDPDPKFSGELVSLLYREGNFLRLATWGKERGRVETLLTPISELSCEFFDAASSSWKTETVADAPMVRLNVGNGVAFPLTR
jgi:hypothetical protein